MERINEATKDCFEAVIQLRQAEAAAVPGVEVLHHRLRREVDEVLRRAAALGFSHQDAQDIAYALVALVDERVLAMHDAYRQFWMSNLLQLHYFNENQAGDGFFTRLHALRKDAHRAEVLRVYYLCLVLGFQGRYAVRGDELELVTLMDAVQKDLERARPFDFDVLSPHGERPADERSALRRRLSLKTGAALALGLVVALYAGLQISLSNITATALLGIAQKRVPAAAQEAQP